MGCFDSNCCLTGLPLHYKDPIRFGLLVPNPHRTTRCYPGGLYEFWIPPVESFYDDYGNLDWEHISNEQRALIEFLFDLMLPSMEYCERSGNENIHILDINIKKETLWDSCVRGDVVIDPSRKYRQAVEKWESSGKVGEPPRRTRKLYNQIFNYHDGPVEFSPWACHAWAWDYVKNIALTSKLDEEAEQVCTTAKMLDDQMFAIIKEKNLDLQSAEASNIHWDLYRKHSRSTSYLIGEYGCISQCLTELIRYLDANQPSLYANFEKLRPNIKAALVETASVCNNLPYLRKMLLPMATVGEQHEEFKYLPAWNELVHNKTQELVNRRYE